MGSSFGMYPAIEIDLHLDRICAAQRQSSVTPEAAFRASTYGTNLLPLQRVLAKAGRNALRHTDLGMRWIGAVETQTGGIGHPLGPSGHL